MSSNRFTHTRRIFAKAGAALFGLSFVSQASASAEPFRVLFVCQAGTVKSPIAREYFKRLAAKRGIAALARARGIAPEDHLSPGLDAKLKADGIDPHAEPIIKLQQQDIDWSQIVIFFDPLPPGFHVGEAKDWTDVPSMNDAFQDALPNLLTKLNSLLDEIAAKSAANTSANT
jgi:hypothetical protein